MKNKEIEKILNELKDEDNYIEEYGFRYKRIALDDWWLLLSYIEQLETDYKEANESVTWWQNRYNAIVKQNDNNHKKVVKLENNRDKAIEYIENHSRFEPPYYEMREFNNKANLSELYNILKGDSYDN